LRKFYIDTKEVPVIARIELNIQAPNFTLNDFNGKSISFADFSGQKNALVVFGGFADPSAERTWCSYAGITINS
jgi:peroxiredoxin